MISIPAAELPGSSTRAHLGFLDGLRGMSAAVVVLYHLWIKHLVPEIRGTSNAVPPWLRSISTFDPYLWAHYAVSAFIVLSGFCLMLPVVRDGRISGGLSGFFKRRARRILPPYYAALAIAWGVIALFHRQIQMEPTNWDLNLPAFSFDVVVSHLLLIQNLNPNWVFQVCGPMWSVPPEWQIYFLFPLLLLPVWRRFGIGVLIATGVVIGALLTHSVPSSALYFTGLFAMGMAAAVVYQGKRHFPGSGEILKCMALPVTERVLPAIGGSCALAAVLLATLGADWSLGHKGIAASFAGGTCACFLIACGRNRDAGRITAALRILEARPVVWLGAWSYSLYLTHTLGLTTAHIAIRSFHLPLAATLMLLVVVALPLSICCSYFFYLAFERPFMTGKKRARVHLTTAPSAEERPLSRSPWVDGQSPKTESRRR